MDQPSLRPMTAADAAVDALTLAPRLLGAHVTYRGVTVRLTEVEAYLGEHDPGSHAFRGLTPRTAPMFRRGGHVYVYFTYGMHRCVNIVAGQDGTAEAVLLRAGEVVAGGEVARSRVGERKHPLPDHLLASGPGRLARALGMELSDSGSDALDPASPVCVALLDEHPAGFATGPRVGVAGPGGDAETYPWRFWLPGERSVSPYRAARPRATPRTRR